MSTITTRDTSPDADARPGRTRAGWVLFLVCAAIFMLMLDATIVSAAFADIRNDFDASIDELQWVVDAYALPLAGLLLSFASAGDRFGRRRIFVTGMAVFTLASLALGLSGTILQLDILRAVQGVGAAMLFATALPLLAAAFPQRAARARAIGVYGAVMAGATVAGPVLGGALVTSFGWRSIFYVNVPIGVVIVIAALALMPETTRASGRRTDWLGSVLLTAGLVSGVFALTRGNAMGWTSATVLGLACAALVLLACFLVWQSRSAHPLLDMSMVRTPGFTGTAVVSVAHMATMMAAANYLALYLVNTLGYTPLQMGLRLLPVSVAALVAAPLAMVVFNRVPFSVSLPLLLGLVGLGMWLMNDFDPDESWTYFVPGMIIAGLGVGAISGVGQAAALTFASDQDAGMSSATFGTLRQVGMAVGVAGLGAMFSHAARAGAGDQLAALPAASVPAGVHADLVEAVGSGAGTAVVDSMPHEFASAAPVLVKIAATASTDGLNAMNTLGATIGLGGAVVAALAFLLARRSRAVHTRLESGVS
ncbi:MFS transporter [Nocardia jejuensis]|uniref:MFS transporter n=1 Tax=Nocardia jejuensis TaxID=328049 RepID=UPI00082DCB12|nr:MFS transporter [Nocardia jejuensis]